MYPDRALAFELQRTHQSFDLYVQMRTCQRGPQIGKRRAAATPIANRTLQLTKAFLLRAVVIRGQCMACRVSGRHERIVQRIVESAEAGGERPLTATPRICPALPRFLPAKIRQHILIGPAVQTGRRPAVVIPGMAAHVGHRVDR